MKLGIMQPYFFPYLGHFSLIAHTDFWVVFDVTQYTPRTWMNRNRILHPEAGWNYITVPLSNSSISIKTFQARIMDVAQMKKSILGKLSHYKRKAPYFPAVEALVHDAFSDGTSDSLVHLNTRGLRSVCEYLRIPFNCQICSELDLPLLTAMHPRGWALEISCLLGATDYVNPIGGRELFNPAEFSARGVSLHFLQTSEFRYDTRPYTFQPGLSILDVLMWNRPKAVLEAIRTGAVLHKAA